MSIPLSSRPLHLSRGKKPMLWFVLVPLAVYFAGFFTHMLWFRAPQPDAELSYIEDIPIYTDYIPEGSRARPGGQRIIQYLVLHETDNFRAGATASAHNAYIHKVANATENLVSWHYTVDDREIFHHLPDDEPAYHAGDGLKSGGGNQCGIGIEMCVNQDGNYEQTLINAQRLCAYLLISYRLKPDALRKHQDFSGKACPGKLLTDHRWEEFCQAVSARYDQLKALPREELNEVS